jgi:catechol 2,3-dioxygenase-like lactoylglutathione lyase family enzyme
MKPKPTTMMVLVLGLSILGSAMGERTGEEAGFTGKLLPVFFVRDVATSVEFYRDVLGFELRHFFDYSEGKQVEQWTREEPPIWALMAAGTQTFALHRAADPSALVIGGMRHYFLVDDVDRHYERVRAAGGQVGPLTDKPWMKLFSIRDPDGHEIFFGKEK